MSKISETIGREIIDGTCFKDIASAINDKLNEQLDKKGFGAWKSRHEILGIIDEEHFELIEAVHRGSLEDVKSELIDLAVGCLFGIACIDSGALDW